MRAVRYYDNSGTFLELHINDRGLEITIEDVDQSITIDLNVGDLASLTEDIDSIYRIVKDFNKGE